MAFTLHDTVEDPRGHYLILICDLNAITYTIVNVYAPNQHQVNFLHKLLCIIKNHQRGRMIICGDFNATPDRSLDSSSGARRSGPSLLATLHAQDLYDAWRCMHAGKRDYTFFSSPHRVYSRINLFLVDHGTLTQVTSTTFNTITWSDHASITLSMSDETVCNVPHMWRSNTYLMQQLDFRNVISKHLREFFSINDSSVQDQFALWNAHKAYIRGIFIQLGARAKRQQQQHIKELTDKIFLLESCNKQKPSHPISQQLTQLCYDLRLLLLENFERASKKLKMTYYATGNKAGKTLAHRIKGLRHKTKIPFILHPFTKHKLYHPQDIADTFSHYYSSLYNLKDDTNIAQPSTDAINTFLQQLDIPTLTQEHLQTLNQKFNTEEINKAIDSLPSNKSPGPDGFYREYYKTFKHLLIPYMERTFNTAAASFPPEMLSAIIVTLPKPGKEPITPQISGPSHCLILT